MTHPRDLRTELISLRVILTKLHAKHCAAEPVPAVQWRAFRTWFAANLEPPICSAVLADGSVCGFAGTSAEMHLDHMVPIERGGAMLDPRNVQWRCRACHGKKTATQDGGFGNES